MNKIYSKLYNWIVTFCLVNKHNKNVTEHYGKVFNIRMEDTHHQGFDPKRTAGEKVLQFIM